MVVWVAQNGQAIRFRLGSGIIGAPQAGQGKELGIGFVLSEMRALNGLADFFDSRGHILAKFLNLRQDEGGRFECIIYKQWC